MWGLFVACSVQDPEVERLSAEVAELKARVEELEARPSTPLPDADEVQKWVDGILRDLDVPTDTPTEVTHATQGLPRAVIDGTEDVTDSARMLLHRGPDGEYDGYRLSAIRRGSLPDRVGLANGDVVMSVNDLPLTSMTQAAEALAEVRRARPAELRVRLTRRGTPTEVVIPVEGE